jgi:DNA invertase Pin-like site-specific DNA recombinase
VKFYSNPSESEFTRASQPPTARGNPRKCNSANFANTASAAAGKWSEMVGEYVDRMTGSKDSRPELNRLMADAHKRRFDVVIVWKFDRFARSVSHLLRALETFKALGIEFVSFSEQLDTSTPAGKLVFTVLGAVAELERSLIIERVRAGMRNARATGKRIGRPPRTQLSMETRTAIAGCYANEKTSLRALAKRFGTSLGTVQRCVGIRPAAASEGHYPLES